MKVLVLNSGSTSLKFQVIEMDTETTLARGLAQNIGTPSESLFTYYSAGHPDLEFKIELDNHENAIQQALLVLLDDKYGVIKNVSEIDVVANRSAHSGFEFTESVLVTDEVIEKMQDVVPLAPLHVPPCLSGIEACQKIMSNTPMVIVFDTTFHRTIPRYAYTYGIDYKAAEKYHIRRYGFHGLSHSYVSKRAAELMGKDIKDLKIITCHLGGGSSMAAIDGGKCIDTSMGFTPTNGLLMATRCGDLDPSVLSYLTSIGVLHYDNIDNFVNQSAGFLGLSGVSGDLREVEAAADKGNEQAQVAIDVFRYGIIKYIGSYYAALKGLDCIVFTAGIGENSITTRKAVVKELEFMGIKLDEKANESRGVECMISTPDSAIKVYVIPTKEELMLAREAVRVAFGKE